MMANLGRFLPNILNYTQRILLQNTSSFHGVATTSSGVTQTLVPGGIFSVAVRNKIRCYFPRPSERMRIKKHGWWHRMSTIGGRRVLMRRILKGRHALSH